jgi:hypothetical protein
MAEDGDLNTLSPEIALQSQPWSDIVDDFWEEENESCQYPPPPPKTARPVKQSTRTCPTGWSKPSVKHATSISNVENSRPPPSASADDVMLADLVDDFWEGEEFETLPQPKAVKSHGEGKNSVTLNSQPQVKVYACGTQQKSQRKSAQAAVQGLFEREGESTRMYMTVELPLSLVFEFKFEFLVQGPMIIISKSATD